MGLRKRLKRWIVGDLRGIHPNSLANLRGQRPENEQDGTRNEQLAKDRAVNTPYEYDGNRPVQASQDDRTRSKGYVAPSGGVPEANTDDGGGDEMNASDAFQLLREFNAMQQQILETERARRREMREELLEMMDGSEAEPMGESVEDSLVKGFASKLLQTPPPPSGSPTEPPPVPVVAPEASPVFSVEHARVVADDLRGRLPTTVLSAIDSGLMGFDVAKSYLAGFNIPEENAKLIWSEIKKPKDGKVINDA